jgi:hypothetical protein
MNIHLNVKHKEVPRVKEAFFKRETAWEESLLELQDQIMVILGKMG